MTGVHDRAGHDAITAELVRLTLGQRGPQRWELNVTAAAALERVRRDFDAMRLEVGRQLRPSLQAMARFITEMPDVLRGETRPDD